MKDLLSHLRRRTAAVLALGMAMAAPSAWAAGTPSSTTISNNAQLTYTVGGVTQNVQSNTASFVVDNVVRLRVQESNTLPTFVSLGASAQVTVFTVTNGGNTAQDYKLTVSQVTGGTISLGATYTDSFDASACQAYVESKSAADGYDAADTATSIVNLAPDGVKTVYVVCNIPSSGPVNGAAAIVALTAATQNANTCGATNPASCVETQETTTANTSGVDVVFGDVATAYDGQRNGRDTDRDAYVIQAALSISKTVTPICDPLNFNSYPKNVPGAYVRYEITVSNGGSQPATLTTITDALPAQIKFDPDLEVPSGSACGPVPPSVTPVSPESGAAGKGFKLTCAGSTNGRACKTTPVFYTGASDGDAVTVTGQTVTATAGATFLPSESGYGVGELRQGESITIRFNAIIQ
jgi:uncharacterized repeat protein (TIGR01451 family)